jgi:hypothetical protein
VQKLAPYWARKDTILWTKVTCMPDLFPAGPPPEAAGGAAGGAGPSGPPVGEAVP